MQKNNNHKTKRYRGSSSPYQETEHGHHEWEAGFKSMNDDSDDSLYLQLLEEKEDQENESDDQEPEVRRNTGERTGQDSIDEVGFRQNQDDESRWQDDGREAG
jgi:hypothetical protein